jgi:hypothetical protein
MTIDDIEAALARHGLALREDADGKLVLRHLMWLGIPLAEPLPAPYIPPPPGATCNPPSVREPSAEAIAARKVGQAMVLVGWKWRDYRPGGAGRKPKREP